MSGKFKQPRFVDVTPETERLADLDHFWIEINRNLKLWRFSYLSDDDTGENIPSHKARFLEPIMMLHGHNKDHKIFNWFARELWYFGFRYLFAIDGDFSLKLDKAARNLSSIIDEIKEITGAQRISIIAHSTGGVYARYFSKFTTGADSEIRILAMIAAPHDKRQLLKDLQDSQVTKSDIVEALDYLEDINSTITEKELYYLTQVNIGGIPWSKNKTREKSSLIPLSDAINIIVGRTHLEIHQHKTTFRILRHYLIPTIAVFKIRLLTLLNISIEDSLTFRIHYRGKLTQKYPQQGSILIPETHDPSEPFIPKVPVIIFTNSFPLETPEDIKISLYAFTTEAYTHKRLGKLDIALTYEKLPRVDYYTLLGDNNTRIDLAIYIYIP